MIFHAKTPPLCPLPHIISLLNITYHISYIIYHISFIIYQISYSIYHISDIRYQISYIIYHSLFLRFHISHITFHISYIIYHISLLHPRWDEQCCDTMMTVPPQLTSSLLSFSYPASFRHLPRPQHTRRKI